MIGADRAQRGLPHGLKIAVEEFIAQVAHLETGRGVMVPKPLSAAHHADRGKQAVGLAGKGAKLGARRVLVDRLVVPGALALQDLVRADHQRRRRAAGDVERLQLGERFRDRGDGRALGFQGLLDFGFVDRCGLRLEGDTGILKQAAAGRTGGGQDDLGDFAHLPWASRCLT